MDFEEVEAMPIEGTERYWGHGISPRERSRAEKSDVIEEREKRIRARTKV